MSDTYNVVIKGSVRDGFNKDQVASKLATVFKIPIDQSHSLLSGKSRTVKKNLAHKKAYVIKRKLEQLGVITELTRIPSRPQVDAALTLVPIEEKVFDDPFDTEIGNTMHEEVESEPAEACPESVDDDTVTVAGVLTAAGVALLGTFIWLQIAMAFEVEVGYVAWFIGGAVGFSMVMSGSSGHGSGIVAATFASLSILGGQYLVYDHFYSGASSALDVMQQEFDFLSGLFLFLGVSTAFKLGTGFEID